MHKGMVVLMIATAMIWMSCGGAGWGEADSLEIKGRKVVPGNRFHIAPLPQDGEMLRNTGIAFEVKFQGTRMQGEGEEIFLTRSHFVSAASASGRVMTQTVYAAKQQAWPAGAAQHEVRINCPFFPFEIRSKRRGMVFFFLAEPGTGRCLSNIVKIPVHIRAK